MIDDAAKTRLANFFNEIKEGQFQFMDCETIDVHTRGFQGETPLKIAVVRQDEGLVSDLLNAGANPNHPGEDNYTPLHHAVSGESLKIIQMLLAHGASTSVINIYGCTPIDYAANKEIFALLTNKKA